MVIPMSPQYALCRARRNFLSVGMARVSIYALCAIMALWMFALLARTLNQPTQELIRLQSWGGGSGGAALSVSGVRASSQHGYTMVIGEARNDSGKQLDNVEAVVEYFNAKHQLLKVESALLEIPTIAPGEEAPFAVQTPDEQGISAYRVRFRHLLGSGISAK